jgi:hypothetical protein
MCRGRLSLSFRQKASQQIMLHLRRIFLYDPMAAPIASTGIFNLCFANATLSTIPRSANALPDITSKNDD